MKPCALFVDGEPLVLNGLRRMLRGLRHEWEMSFAQSGEEALALLEERDFAVIVSDMRMPGMDGAILLEKAASRQPGMARLVLSGRADIDAIMRVVRPAHQFLTKPCDSKLLEQILLRIQHIRSDERLRDISNKLGAHQRLPSSMQRIKQLRTALAKAPADLKEVGEIVGNDIAMSAQVLRLVNSAFFGQPVRTFDPVQAVTILGVDIMKHLLDYIELFRPVSDPDGAGNAAVIEVHERIDALASELPARPDVAPKTLAMMSLLGAIAVIEAPDPVDPEDERALGKLLLAYWGLDIVPDGAPSVAPAGARLKDVMLLGA